MPRGCVSLPETSATASSSPPKETPSKPANKPSTPATSPPAAKPAASPAKPKPSAAAPVAKPAAPSSAPPKAEPAPKVEAKPEVKKAKAEEKPAAKKPAPSPPRKWEKKAAAKPSGPLPKVVDASGLVLGRAASLLAKRLLQGETIAVVNTEKALVLGGRASLMEEYRLAVARGSVRKGPHYPRRPDRMFRRTVRGMLPFRHTKGREAWSRLITYVGIPSELASLPRETLEGAKPRPSLKPPMTLGEVSRHVGGVGPW
ncbi:MAG: 50S ribosomal protein L13 [Euryarchaeota archaeon]|nr:50S ribosomal protein L13 [Euryarchaeota archaeon]MDE1837854.1 50S ribosomal protein L13 [Euryarchaeota archaeon]MDE1880138.1 50S ribosomal protein L13 [Euryarchaeota archaeon]MDE2046285.1 50S ribosomal protein L13 [Thermoplasmata archaeon]